MALRNNDLGKNLLTDEQQMISRYPEHSLSIQDYVVLRSSGSMKKHMDSTNNLQKNKKPNHLKTQSYGSGSFPAR